VPQRDPRARGWIQELHTELGPSAFATFGPGLAELVELLPPRPGTALTIALNETPRTDPDGFFLRPHVDRRWLGKSRFGVEPPLRTAIVFLAFPPDGSGGELVVFDPGRWVPREHGALAAREAISRAGGHLVEPVPGRACFLEGEQVHAMLGYSTTDQSARRLAAVLAEFALE